MKLCMPRHRLLAIAVVVLVLTASYGCSEDRGGTATREDGPAIDWDSPRMREIEKEWKARDDAYNAAPHGGKVEFEEYRQSVDRLFQERLSLRRLRELTASSKIPPVPEEQGTFAYAMLAYMVKAFVESGDRQGLVELLAKRCPSVIEWPEYLEFYVANRSKRLKDPILVLGEPYTKCGIAETRHALAAAVRRGFAGYGIRGKDDAEFVSNAMQWYQKNNKNLAVNNDYIFNVTSNEGAFTIESYERHPEYHDNPPRARDPLFK